MAGSIVVTETILEEPVSYPALSKTGRKIAVDWTSDASGNVTGTTVKLKGFMVKARFKPSGGGTAPTDNYDHTLPDPDDASFDAAQGKFVDRDAAVSEEVYPAASGGVTPLYFNGDYDFKIANAGNAKQGTVVYYMLNS